MTSGKMMEGSDIPPSCGVICSGWPSWCIGLHLRGWSLKIVIHKNSLWVSHLASWFPTAIIIDIKDVLPTFGSNGVDHWFSDVEPPRKLGLWHTSICSISCLRRIRHVPNSNWKVVRHSLSHVNAGGLTDGSWSIYHYASHEGYQLKVANSRPFRDLRSVLQTTIEGRSCPPPKILNPSCPTVVELRPNTYHGSGILPLANRNCFIIAPSVFSPTSWVRRRIADPEWFSILDIPDYFLQSLTAEECKSIIKDTSFIPLGIVFMILDSFPESTSSLMSNDSNPVCKKVCVETSDSTTMLPFVNCKSLLPVEPPNDRLTRNIKATKNDDAEVPVYLWNEAIVLDGDPKKIEALDVLRSFALRWWRKHTTRDFLKWMSDQYPPSLRKSREYKKDRVAGMDCLSRCANSSWWEWSAGSRPLFWR